MAAPRFIDEERRGSAASPPAFDYHQGSLKVSNEAAARLEYRKRLQNSVPFIVRWMNHLQLPLENVILRMRTPDEKPKITTYNLFEALQNGLLLNEIHEATSCSEEQKIRIRGVNKKPVTRAIMLKNLEIAIRYIWGHCARASNMCTPLDFYHGEASKVLPCLLEMMDVWVFKKNRVMVNKTLQEINTLCEPYNRAFLPESEAVNMGPTYDIDNALAPDFADGLNIAIMLTSLDFVTESELLPKMYGKPRTQAEYIHNYKLILYFMRKCFPDMPLLLRSPVDWCRPPLPCPETLILQLNLLAQEEVKRAESDFVYDSLAAVFRFLGDSCRREELREALNMSALTRALKERFSLSKEDVMKVMNANCKDDWLQVSELVAWCEHYREHRDRESEWRVDMGLNMQSTFAKDLPMPTKKQLQAVYVEDLRRHYEVGKNFYVATSANKNDGDFDDDTFEARDCDEPTTEVLGVRITFSRLMDAKTFRSCHAYTTVVPCADQFRFLLVLRDLVSMNILLKVDVGNLQVHGNTIRILNRTALRRKKNVEDQMGQEQKVLGLPEVPTKQFADGEEVPKVPRSNFALGPLQQTTFASGADYLEAHPLHTRELYSNIGANQGFKKDKAAGEFLEMTLNFTRNMYERLIVEEIEISTSQPDNSAQTLRVNRFLEELRILTHFLPMREKLPAVNIY
eukprot:g9361.t1